MLATANPAKARELRELLEGLDYEVVDLGAWPALQLPPEDQTSYEANARRKAEAVAAATGLVALADDSGIEVDALGGRPGPASARYGGPDLTDAQRVVRLLGEVGEAPVRTARFRCVLALAAPWGETAVVEGVVEGELARVPRGTGGFGYDPVFVPCGSARTFAELAPADKHAVSHRGRAVARARPILARWRAGAAAGA